MKHKLRKIGIWTLVLLLVLPLWMLASLFSHRWRNLSSAPEKGNNTLTVLTYNTHRMGNFEKVGKNAVIQYLQQTDADVVCLQEVEVYKQSQYLTLNELREAMARYPYTYYDFKVYNNRRQYGNVVFSMYPLIHKHTINYASKGNITSCCDVVVKEDTIRLMVNHLESNRISVRDNRDTVLTKIESASKIRRKQAWQVKKAMLRSPYPLIVVGDFNAIPIGLTYQCMRIGMRDCFLETSRGSLGSTYQGKWWGARIDYILCSYRLKPYRCMVDKVTASDHYPVIAAIEWAPDSGNR